MKATYTEEYEGRYSIVVNGEVVGHVQRIRVAVRPTNGSRIRSGASRSEWKCSGWQVGFPSRRKAVEAFLRHEGIEAEA